MIRKTISLLFIVIFSLFIQAGSVSAIGLGGFDANDISVEITPDPPSPGDTISIRIDSSATELNNHLISWFVNKKEVSSGQGKKTLRTTLGKEGQETEILIVIRLREGGVVEKKITLNPSNLELIWEAETYTPPFFKGKALFTREARVKVIAIPHILRNGSEVSADNLVYKWTKNGEVLGDINGYGKSFITIQGTIIGRDLEIEVEATDSITGNTAYGSTIIRTQDPTVLLYKKDPLYGLISQKALTGKEILQGKEIELIASPYFFSVQNPYELSYIWRINGQNLNDNDNSPTKIFRKVGDVFGVSDITVDVSHTVKALQGANKSIRIDFQKTESNINSDFGNLN
jgi:hypothetical protein